jgi:outer membrane lipoprotein carrier protein
MTASGSRNFDDVIPSEGREANEPKGPLLSPSSRHPERSGAKSKDLPLFFRTLQSPEHGCPIQAAPSAAWAGKHRLIKLLLLTFSLLSFLPIQAQQPTVHDLAQRVDRHYNQLHSLKAQFVENYEGMGRMRTESGTLLLLKPGRMRWDYTKPAGKLFLLDGKYAWFYSKGDPQVQRIGAKELDDLRSPLRFLLGHTKLEKEIDHLAVTPAANGSFTLAGVPHGQEKRVQRLALTVTSDGVITAMEIQETDGAETRFTFNDEQPNAPIPPATFRFTPPPGVPVVDTMPPV